MNKYIVFWGFIFISLIVKEFHPFTKSQMYNSFPTQSHNFYITDHQNNILPIRDYFNYSSQDLAHNFEALSNYKYPKKELNEAQIKDIGKELFSVMLLHQKKTLPKEEIKLYRMENHLENKKIIHSKFLIFNYDNI